MPRTKGSLNKATLDLHERCRKAGVDPFEILLELCRSDDEKIRLGAASDACGYIYAKKRSVEMKLDVEAELIERAQAIKEMPTEVLKKIAK